MAIPPTEPDPSTEPEPTNTELAFRMGLALGRIEARLDDFLARCGIDPYGPEVTTATEAAAARKDT